MELNRRNTFRGTINRIHDFTNDVPNFEAATIVALKGRFDVLKTALNKLEAEHLNLVEDAADQAAVDVHNDYYKEVEEIFMETSTKIQERIEYLENEARQNAAAQQANNNVNNVNNNNNNNPAPPVTATPDMPLERLKLPSFNGDHAKWPEWISMFKSLVHTKNYDSTEKFHYLKTALKDSAADTVKGWNVTGENYQAAYDSLVALYENPYRITLALLDELFKLERLGAENYENLRLLINTINTSTRQLTVVGCPVQHWDNILVHFLLTRMPKSTLTQWETSRDLREMPTLVDVISFLERQARGHLNLANGTKDTNTVHHQNNTGAKPKQNKQHSNGNGSKQTAGSLGINCSVCDKPHPTFRCARFDEMNTKQRRSKVSELKLCFVCLLPGHRAGSNLCKLGNCPICTKRHNRILCDQIKSINSATIQSMEQQRQQQLPSNASANQMAQASGSVQYQGPINQMQASVWNQTASNTNNNQNFQ